MRQWVLMGVAALALGGCIPPGRPQAPVASMPKTSGSPGKFYPPQSIEYETGPCFGACPVYSVKVSYDGEGKREGVFIGKRFTAVTGERKFNVTPEQFDAFASALEPYLPGNGERLYQPGSKLCENAATDMPSVDIRRNRAVRGVVVDHLYFYFGCDLEKNRAMRDALGHAAEALPIAELIGARP